MGQLVRTIFLAFQTPWPLVDNLLSFFFLFFFFSLFSCFSETFAVCLDNSFSRFSGKLVYLYIVSYVIADWTAYTEEFSNIHSIAENFSVSFCRCLRRCGHRSLSSSSFTNLMQYLNYCWKPLASFSSALSLSLPWSSPSSCEFFYQGDLILYRKSGIIRILCCY